MALTTTTTSVSYTGDGSTTVFSVPFAFRDDSHIVVKVTPSGGSQSTLTLGVHYTVSGEAATPPGSVTFVTAPALNTAIVISRSTTLTQLVSIPTQGPFSPSVIEGALDAAIMAIQERTDGFDDVSADIEDVLEDFEALEERMDTVEEYLDEATDGDFDAVVSTLTALENKLKLTAMLDFRQTTAPIAMIERYSVCATGLQTAAGATPAVQLVLAGAGGVLHSCPSIGGLWTSRTSGFGASDIWGVASNGTTLLAFGDGPKVATSTNGTTWTLRTAPTVGSDIRVAVWGASLSLWVAAGDGLLASSPDGITWTNRTTALGAGDDCDRAAFGNGTFLLVDRDNPDYQTSTNGTSWTARVFPGDMNDVIYSTRLSLFIASDSTNDRIYTSPDAITWTLRLQMSGAGDIYFAETSSYVLAIDGPSGHILTSPDGLTWTRRTAVGLVAVSGQEVYPVSGPDDSLFFGLGSGTTHFVAHGVYTP